MQIKAIIEFFVLKCNGFQTILTAAKRAKCLSSASKKREKLKRSN